MAKNDVFKLAGLTDLQKKLSFVTKSYPDKSEKLLTKMGNQFRKEVKKKTPERPHGTSKKKLINSYKVSLVEHGHRIVVGGRRGIRVSE